MNLPLILAFLFFIGSVLGWCLELVFRRFFSKNNLEHKWINPGFCTGPYLPIYGTGLCFLFLIAMTEDFINIDNVVLNKIILFIVMAIWMTVVEYIAGYISIKVSNVKLWDYSKEWGNINGIICPKFSFYWAILGAVYYFLVHPHILEALEWLSKNLAFSFFIGLFFGVFIIDIVNSAQIIVKMKKFAKDNDVILHYEKIKLDIKNWCDETENKYHFFRPFKTDKPLHDHLKEVIDTFHL